MPGGTPDPQMLARLMSRLRGGDPSAAGHLMETYYPELRRMAGRLMKREGAGHTWQPTVLINELFLELVRIKRLPDDPESIAKLPPDAFLGLAGHIMKRLLTHHARPLYKRAIREDVAEMSAQWDAAKAGPDELAQVEDVLRRLEAIDPRLRRVVELRVFQGLTRDEIARELGCGTATVAREWAFAKQFLEEQLP
jgi:RNA polymerase sigma factor (TIGR02999 family)